MTSRRDELADLLVAARRELHRYASRMLGSGFDGEDVVQDVAERALRSIETLDSQTPLKPWLLRIAHNRVVDVLRARDTRAHSAALIEGGEAPETPQEALERAEIVSFALSRFVRLPVTQRSVLILKDVLELSLEDITAALDLSPAAAKAQLHRARLAVRAQPPAPDAPPVSPGPETARYADLFNRRDWGALRALLAEEVRVVQHARATLRGPEQVAGTFLSIYGRLDDWRMAPARAEGRDVVAALDPDGQTLLYVTRVEWRDGEIVEIHDYRHVRYVVEDMVVARAGW